MDAAELKLLKQYMHVDHDDDDELIKRLWAVKVRSLSKAGVMIDASDKSDPGWLAAAGMTLEAYDGTPLPIGVRLLINQLKLDDPTF